MFHIISSLQNRGSQNFEDAEDTQQDIDDPSSWTAADSVQSSTTAASQAPTSSQAATTSSRSRDKPTAKRNKQAKNRKK
ncbi:Prolyl 3-hydroxylase OGFOD1 [Frankliniella fusca]|uniref:Prolyl 3-hydroxylase OGFOD1 n=1 Tax=Frankliniella fusca TaxID=407009 RepID=A0AAE1L8H8_9NEOP|nr:Prolyl 3-hydroxylase OGFOD1 [Frankliniella fusca]